MRRNILSSIIVGGLLLLHPFEEAPAIAAQNDCGQPVSTGGSPLASDALAILRSAVGARACELCVCDTAGNGSITASDALLTLKKAVGQPVELACVACETTTTTSTTTTTMGEPPELEGIVDAHNEVRAEVGVGPLVWSDALAATAKAWGETCTDNQAPAGLLDHNPDRSDGHPYLVGENIYGTSGQATAEKAMDNWASEKANYNYAANTCQSICGHYTQIVWEDSLEVGCALVECPSLTFGSTIICDYGPAGNTGGRPY